MQMKSRLGDATLTLTYIFYTNSGLPAFEYPYTGRPAF